MKIKILFCYYATALRHSCLSDNAGVIWSWPILSTHLCSSKRSREFSQRMCRDLLRWHWQECWRLRFLNKILSSLIILYYYAVHWFAYDIIFVQTSREIKISGAIGPCISLNAKGPCVSENVSSSTELNQTSRSVSFSLCDSSLVSQNVFDFCL